MHGGRKKEVVMVCVRYDGCYSRVDGPITRQHRKTLATVEASQRLPTTSERSARRHQRQPADQ